MNLFRNLATYICFLSTASLSLAANSPYTKTDYAQFDVALNKHYKALMAVLDDEQKTAVRNAQRQWISYRDATCAAELTLFDAKAQDHCLAALTEQKANSLQQQLKRIAAANAVAKTRPMPALAIPEELTPRPIGPLPEPPAVGQELTIGVAPLCKIIGKYLPEYRNGERGHGRANNMLDFMVIKEGLKIPDWQIEPLEKYLPAIKATKISQLKYMESSDDRRLKEDFALRYKAFLEEGLANGAWDELSKYKTHLFTRMEGVKPDDKGNTDFVMVAHFDVDNTGVERKVMMIIPGWDALFYRGMGYITAQSRFLILDENDMPVPQYSGFQNMGDPVIWNKRTWGLTPEGRLRRVSSSKNSRFKDRLVKSSECVFSGGKVRK